MANNMLVFVVTMVVVLVNVYQVSSQGVGLCGCYKVVMSFMSTCPNQTSSVFTLTGANLTLNEDCTLVPQGCLAYGAFSSSIVSVALSLPFLTEVGSLKFNACKGMPFLPSYLQAMLKAMNGDIACPVVTANKVCAIQPFTNYNLGQVPFFLDLLEMASQLGPATTTIKATHGSNITSCIKLVGEVKRDPNCIVPTVPTTLLTMPSDLTTLCPGTVTVPMGTVTVPTVTVTVPTVPVTVPTVPALG